MTATASPPGELEPIETASIDELRALQLGRLRWSLRHAYQNVPYYRDAFDAAAIHPDDVRDLADLARFPFTTGAQLRDNYPFGMLTGAAAGRPRRCTPRPGPPAAPPWSATPPPTSTPGRR